MGRKQVLDDYDLLLEKGRYLVAARPDQVSQEDPRLRACSSIDLNEILGFRNNEFCWDGNSLSEAVDCALWEEPYLVVHKTRGPPGNSTTTRTQLNLLQHLDLQDGRLVCCHPAVQARSNRLEDTGQQLEPLQRLMDGHERTALLRKNLVGHGSEKHHDDLSTGAAAFAVHSQAERGDGAKERGFPAEAGLALSHPPNTPEKRSAPRDLASYEVARQIREYLFASESSVHSFRNGNGETYLEFRHGSDIEVVTLKDMCADFAARNAGRGCATREKLDIRTEALRSRL
ncbi:MAG: hypothetical protein LQ340_007896 [Diploschistes diacapsis]|nr:MAG: hypothetical protein LQ340_007896 [Diploschistes diacapsis]